MGHPKGGAWWCSRVAQLRAQVPIPLRGRPELSCLSLAALSLSLLCFLGSCSGEVGSIPYFLLNILPLILFFFSLSVLFLEKTVQKNALPT